ncbi:MAG: hypothetical protein IJ702_03320 [Fretibacterium sp.]|nr:hypothetical protein [Fretibacterium sp.]
MRQKDVRHRKELDAAYDAMFKKAMTREEFYEMNRLACERLKEEAGDGERIRSYHNTGGLSVGV